MSTTKIVLVSGGNTGLGLEICKALSQSSKAAYTVLVGGRSLEKATATADLLSKDAVKGSEVKPIQIDISSDESIASCLAQVEKEYGRIDTLINNAGVSLDVDVLQGKMTARAAFHEMLDTNITSTHVFTEAFAPLLIKSSSPRLIFITSGTSSIDEAARGLPYTAPKYPAGWPKTVPFSFTGYRTSKAGLNMLAVEWSRILDADNVKVFSISPGFLATGLAGVGAEQLKKMGAQDPSVGGNFVKDVVEGVRDADVGKVLRGNDTVQPW